MWGRVIRYDTGIDLRSPALLPGTYAYESTHAPHPVQPDFHASAPPDVAKPLYNQFVDVVRKQYLPEKVSDGVFGAMMHVGLVNDGPVTFDFDTGKSGSVGAEKAKEAKRMTWLSKKEKGMKKKKEGSDRDAEGERMMVGRKVSEEQEEVVERNMEDRVKEMILGMKH